MKKIYILFILICIQASNSFANSPLWKFSKDQERYIPGERKIVPQQYEIAQLGSTHFKLLQPNIPLEESGKYSLIALPTPDGNMMNFRIFESPMMEKPLADKYPMIKTYTAISTENEWITAKLDYTPAGFHAMVFNAENTYFIDPYSNENTDYYIVYYKRDFVKPLHQRLQCEIGEGITDFPETDKAISLVQEEIATTTYSNKQNGTNKRTYRLALACTVEYALAVNGPTPTKAGVLAAMTTSVNRVNGVFEREFSMRLNLVANTDELIWITAAGEPYTNGSGSAMLGQNQTQVTNKIGSANYDIGHVFSTGGGGIASLGCVCNSNNKAQGVTGSSNPVGDPFDIDYVAHEMGHQFGGEHTFNSITGSCSGNRSSSSAFEPGSGSTIQCYAGLCGTDNLQLNSDDYYHIRSLEQMTGNNIMTCAANVASNNTLPILAAIAKTYIIPFRTPFELTASGSDGNNNPLTYCWEEYDRGGNGAAWDATTTVAPIWRSFYPTTSNTRTFPSLKPLLLAQESIIGERLPNNARTLRFRCTLRDINNGYGAFFTSTDTVKLDVRTTTGLFRVTSQSATTNWNAGSTQTITWTNAGTDVAPVNCPFVQITMSKDSGRTFPHILADNVPNNGTANIEVPKGFNSDHCRVKVKGKGNVFFNINTAWIKVKDPTSTNDLKEEMPFAVYPNPVSGQVTIMLEEENESHVEILNSIGSVLYRNKIKKELKVSLIGYANGIYFVQITNSKGLRAVKKITKQ